MSDTQKNTIVVEAHIFLYVSLDSAYKRDARRNLEHQASKSESTHSFSFSLHFTVQIFYFLLSLILLNLRPRPLVPTVAYLPAPYTIPTLSNANAAGEPLMS
jgi:hypothetical protein